MKLILLVLCQIMIFGIYKVPNHLLEPNLSYNGIIIINRLSFGLHIPFSKSSIMQWGLPKKNDIILVVTKQNKNLMRRVIALPREEFMFRGKRLVVPDNTVFVGLFDEYTEHHPKEFGFVPVKNILGKCVFVLD